MHLSLKSKIRLTLLSIIFFFTFFILFYFPRKQANSLRKSYESEIQNLAEITAADVTISLDKHDYEGMANALKMVKVDDRFNFICLLLQNENSNGDKHIISYDTNFVSNKYQKESVSFHSDKNQIVKSADLTSGHSKGKIILCYGTHQINKGLKEIRFISIFFSIMVLIAGLFVSFVFARNITFPVYALRNAALKVGEGDYSQRVQKTSGDEIGELGNAFNKMVKDLSATQSQLLQSEKLASLGQLTAGVAHEINNPINFVSGNITPLKRDIEEIMSLLEKYTTLTSDNYQYKFVEILQFKEKIDLSYTIEEIKSLIKGIEEGSKRTAEIVKGLRNFTRPDDEQMRLSDINEGINSTLLLLQNKLSLQKIEVIKKLGTLPEIQCFPGQLNQVFLNLLSNAIDAMEENGKLIIETSSKNNHIKISVKDTGTGMSEEVRKKIFDPFFTTKDVGKGTGLGLSISYGIIAKHKGKIEVNSEVGKGTEFVILLPL